MYQLIKNNYKLLRVRWWFSQGANGFLVRLREMRVIVIPISEHFTNTNQHLRCEKQVKSRFLCVNIVICWLICISVRVLVGDGDEWDNFLKPARADSNDLSRINIQNSSKWCQQQLLKELGEIYLPVCYWPIS